VRGPVIGTDGGALREWAGGGAWPGPGSGTRAGRRRGRWQIRQRVTGRWVAVAGKRNFGAHHIP